MSTRSQLPLQDRASAEACTALERKKAPGAFPFLFPDPAEQPDDARTPRRDRLLHQLREYSKRLFMCQARFYKKNAPDEATLRSWLKRVALSVAKETIKETRAAFANARCTVSEREREVRKGLKEEADFWIARYRKHSSQLLTKASHPVDETGSTSSSEEISSGSPKGNNRTQENDRPLMDASMASRGQLSAKEPINSGTNAKRARAITVAKLIKELNDLKPQMFEDESEYSRLRAVYPDFATFKIVEQRPDLKTKVLAIQGSTRHIRLAQELAAAHHGRQLSTIQDDWKRHKPVEFKHPK
jgi:hypothetical protein